MGKRIIDNLIYGKTISLVTLIAINSQDFGLIMFFLIKAMETNQMINYYLFLFFIFIFIIAFFSMRLMIFVWRIKHNFLNNNQINTHNFRKKFYIFQMNFYFVMLAYYTLMHLLFTFHPLMIMLMSMILYPQIILNLKLQLHKFDKFYIFFFIFPRFFLLLYFRSCPKNIENLRPYPILSSLSFVIFLVSVGIIYLQTQYGSYFFIPRCLRWKQFNYFIKTSKLRKELLGDDIYMTQNKDESNISSGIKKWVSGFIKKKNDKKDLNDTQDNFEEISYNQSMISKDQSIIKSDSKLKQDSELAFIKMEEPKTTDDKAEENKGILLNFFNLKIKIKMR